MEGFTPGRVRFTAMRNQPRFTRHAVEESQPVIFSLETQEIVIGQCFQDLVVLRKRCEDLRCREGNMQEEADTVVDAASSQLSGKGQKMIIVDP